jgi:hypothetical protein
VYYVHDQQSMWSHRLLSSPGGGRIATHCYRIKNCVVVVARHRIIYKVFRLMKGRKSDFTLRQYNKTELGESSIGYKDCRA